MTNLSPTTQTPPLAQEGGFLFPADMTPAQFRRIRESLGFTQQELADFLGYGRALRISEFERDTNPRPVPELLARLMIAYRDGYRPKDWPREK